MKRAAWRGCAIAKAAAQTGVRRLLRIIEINSKGRRQKKSDADCAVFDLVARIPELGEGRRDCRCSVFCVWVLPIYFFFLEALVPFDVAFEAFDVAFEAFDAPDTTEKI